MTMRHRALVRASVLLGVAALGLTACTGGTGHRVAASPAAPVSSASVADAVQPWQDPLPFLRTEATRILADTGRHTGTGLSIPLPATPRGTVWIAIACRGHGSLTVNAGHVGTYHLPCAGTGNGDETDDYAAGPVPAGTLSVPPAPGITWQVAVGWSATVSHPDRLSTHTPTAHTPTVTPRPRPRPRTPPRRRTPSHATSPHPESTRPTTAHPAPAHTHTTVRHTPPPHHTTVPRRPRRSH